MKKRADILLVEQGLVDSRSRAQAEITAGHVYAADEQIQKPAQKIQADVTLRLTQEALAWVSRAGLKLEHALAAFDIDLAGHTVLDLGASTGGFTQVALSRGAAHVYAVDVGHGQLHDSLARHADVTSLEGVNARHVSADLFARPIEALVCDLSFISLKLGLPGAMELCRPGSTLIALIKPQFEAGKKNIGRGGIVKDLQVRSDVVADIESWMSAQSGWQVLGVTDSPITGSDGNKEFLIAAQKNSSKQAS